MPDTEHAFSKIPTDSLSRDLAGLTRLGENFGAAMSDAFLAAAADGRKLSGVLRSLVQSLGSRALAAALRPLSDAAGNLFGGALGAVLANAKGNVVSAGRIRAFASGGIVNGPTLFPLNSGMGLMGEKGAEAILPLARSSDGKLGVRAGAASLRIRHHEHHDKRCRELPPLRAADRRRARSRRRAGATQPMSPPFTKCASRPPSRAVPAVDRSAAPRSSRLARVSRSATRAGPMRGDVTMPATACGLSTTSMPSSPSSRNAAAASTVFAGATMPTSGPVAPGRSVSDADQELGMGDGATAAFELRKIYGVGPSAL